jgi:hypothetical protein
MPTALTSNLQTWIILQLVVATILFLALWKRKESGVGLVLTYIMIYMLHYWIAPFFSTLPWNPQYDFELRITVEGLKQSTYGLMAFTLGVMLMALRSRTSRLPSHKDLTNNVQNTNSSSTYIVLGILSYLLHELFHGLPTITAFIGAGQLLFSVGICIEIWSAKQQGRRPTKPLIFGALLPLYVAFFWGFLGYGLVYFLFMLVLGLVVYRNIGRVNSSLALLVLLMLHLSLSLYVSYWRDREQIRSIAWGGASVGAIVSQAAGTLYNLESFDPRNPRHLSAISERFDLSLQTGQAVTYLQSGFRTYARGETIVNAFLALIPRILWPGKPYRAGGSDFVTFYTGIRYGEGTSVGPGVIMELFVNFGTAGVCVGMLLMGLMLSAADRAAYSFLKNNRYDRFALVIVPVLEFLRIEDFLAVHIASAGAGLAVTTLVNRLMRSRSDFWAKNTRNYGRSAALMSSNKPAGEVNPRAERIH